MPKGELSRPFNKKYKTLRKNGTDRQKYEQGVFQADEENRREYYSRLKEPRGTPEEGQYNPGAIRTKKPKDVTFFKHKITDN